MCVTRPANIETREIDESIEEIACARSGESGDARPEMSFVEILREWRAYECRQVIAASVWLYNRCLHSSARRLEIIISGS